MLTGGNRISPLIGLNNYRNSLPVQDEVEERRFWLKYWSHSFESRKNGFGTSFYLRNDLPKQIILFFQFFFSKCLAAQLFWGHFWSILGQKMFTYCFYELILGFFTVFGVVAIISFYSYQSFQSRPSAIGMMHRYATGPRTPNFKHVFRSQKLPNIDILILYPVLNCLRINNIKSV